MDRHHFISYSSADAKDFALRLCDALTAGPPSIPAWLDKRRLVAGTDWDEQIVDAIRDCESLIFVMTRDSVTSNSICKKEWTRALKYKKPIIPILLHPDAEMPFSLEPRQHIDFTGDFDPALARLRNDLQYLSSPAGVLQQMKDRLADAHRDLPRASDDAKRIRIQDDITQLERQIADQQKIVDDPEGAAKRVQESIERGLERELKPERPVTGAARSRFINPPPSLAPSYFQDRHVETELVGDFLKDESLRMMTIVGRGGIGKTAMVCRLLKSLENGRLPDDLGPMNVDGIVYLSARGSRRVNAPNIYADLNKLLPEEEAQRLDTLFKNPQASTEAKMQELLAAFPTGRTVLLLDNFEDMVDSETQNIPDVELDEALRTVLKAPHHVVKVIITTRIAPRDLMLMQPGRQRRLDLDEGLESPFAENILREMDPGGKLGLKFAPDELLTEVRNRTRGYPRALEAMFAILSADRDTSLRDILNDTEKLLPDNVINDLVGEAFSRLDSTAQQVMQALAIYEFPVTPVAVDYLLQPSLPGVNSAPILARLVNMRFARKEAGCYYLHPVDNSYAFARVPEGEKSDRETARFTQFALKHRGADYFRQVRTQTVGTITIEEYLMEYSLRYEGQDFDGAAAVLLEMHADLFRWGFYYLIVSCGESLIGNLNDHHLELEIIYLSGDAYHVQGLYQAAISRFEYALNEASEEEESTDVIMICLVGLGICYDSLGQSALAIQYYEQAFVIAAECKDRIQEASILNNLGWSYAGLGQTTQAKSYYQKALEINREIEDLEGQGYNLNNLAEVLIDEKEYPEAIQLLQESIKIGVDVDSPRRGSYSNGNLALLLLYTGNLMEARAAAEAARKFEEPDHNHYVLALLGLIALRQEDTAAAQESFATAISETDKLLSYTAQNFNALNTKGLALCGLTLCDGVNRTSAAIEAYKAARAINKDAGIVARVLRLFDALAVVDSAGILKEVRAAAAGESDQNKLD